MECGQKAGYPATCAGKDSIVVTLISAVMTAALGAQFTLTAHGLIFYTTTFCVISIINKLSNKRCFIYCQRDLRVVDLDEE